MTWYQDPTIVGALSAIGAAIITAAVSVYLWHKAKKTRHLSCMIATPQSLLAVKEEIRDRLSITFDSKPVKSVYRFVVRLANTGNSAIEDQPITIRLAEGSEIIEYQTKHKPEIGFGGVHETLCDGNKLDLRVDLLNPGDYFGIGILSIQNPSEDIKIGLKNKDVAANLLTFADIKRVFELTDKFPPLVLFKLPMMFRFIRAVRNIRALSQADGAWGAEEMLNKAIDADEE